MIPVYVEIIDTCVVCGDVCGSRDLLYVESDDEVAGAGRGDLVCRHCAGAPGQEAEE